MSSHKAFTSFSLAVCLVVVVAGLSYVRPTFAWTLKSGGLLGLAGENSNLLIYCTPSLQDPATWNTYPNASPPHVDVKATMLCTGYQADNTSAPFTTCAAGTEATCANSGYFEWQIIYNLPDCTYSDSNRGHGNEVCSSVDPQNTGNGGTQIKGSIQSKVTCTNTGPAQSTVTWGLYCEEGVDPNFAVAMDDTPYTDGPFDDTNASYVVWVPRAGYSIPPSWTNCPLSGTFDGDQPACRVRIGGFPIKSKGGNVLTDNNQCAKIFPAQGILASQQVLSYTETRDKQCGADGKPDPTATPTPGPGSMRFCDSAFGPMGTAPGDAQSSGLDGFDDVYRRCAQVQ